MPGSSLLRCSPKSACPEGGRARQEVGAVSMGPRAAGAAGPADPREFAKSLEICKKVNMQIKLFSPYACMLSSFSRV